MRVVLIGPTYPFRGGISHYTTLLCHHLRKEHEVDFVSFRRQYPRWLFPGRTDRDPSQWPITERNLALIDPFNPWTWVQAARHIRQQDPDLLLLQWWVPFWALAWLSIIRLSRRHANPRVILISHNVTPHEEHLLDRILARWVLSRGDVIIVHSEPDRDAVLHLLPKARVHVTAHPTYQVFAQEAPASREARRSLGLDGDTPVMLFFGFVRPYKGLHYLIDALPLVLESLNVHLLIAGEFWDDIAPYQVQIRSLGLEGQVTIVDRYIPNEEVSTYFAAADLVTLPYVAASQSGIIQIAFGFGVPIVTTKVGGLAEAVRDGYTGLLVPPKDSEALAAAILRYFREGLESRLRGNIEAQKDLFAWEAMVSLIEELARG